MSTTKITERNLDEKFLQSLYTTDNPPTASDVGAVAESDLATAIQSLIGSGVISMSAVKSVQRGVYTHSNNSDASITISAVNPAKCVVILDSSLTSVVSGSLPSWAICAYESTLVSLAASKLTISSNYCSYSVGGTTSNTYGKTSWQVIEYA